MVVLVELIFALVNHEAALLLVVSDRLVRLRASAWDRCVSVNDERHLTT
jgi:hypothetical protein